MTKDNVDMIKEQFGREAKKYVTSQVHSNKEDLDFVRNFVAPQKSWRILDIATGSGHLALTLAPYVQEVIASDITQQMLDQTDEQASLRKIGNIETRIVDAHMIDNESNDFDLVSSRIAPHHFHNIDKAIEEMIRVTKSSGYIFIQDTISPENIEAGDYFNLIEKLRDPSHIKDLTPSEWIKKFVARGCELIKFERRTKVWPLQWWMDRMSTSPENQRKIRSLLENEAESYSQFVQIDKKDDWEIRPFNGYFLFKKS